MRNDANNTFSLWEAPYQVVLRVQSEADPQHRRRTAFAAQKARSEAACTLYNHAELPFGSTQGLRTHIASS